jgi:hypothetical protein
MPEVKRRERQSAIDHKSHHHSLKNNTQHPSIQLELGGVDPL